MLSNLKPGDQIRRRGSLTLYRIVRRDGFYKAWIVTRVVPVANTMPELVFMNDTFWEVVNE